MDVAVVVVFALFCVLGILIGWKAGSLWGASAEGDCSFWLRNLAVLLGGSVLCAFILASGLVTLVGLGVGLIGGAVAGLKMGYGKSVGAWRKHDEAFRVNRDQVAAAKAAERARAAGMGEDEMAARDLVSVAGPGSGKNDGEEAAVRRTAGRKGGR